MSYNMHKLEIKYKGMIFRGDTTNEIHGSIMKYLTKRKIAAEINLFEIVEENSKLIQKRKVKEKFAEPSKKKINFDKARNGAIALLSVTVEGAVDQSEINRRASLCTNCPKVNKVSNCFACGFGGAIVRFVNGLKKLFKSGFTIPNNLESRYCGVCNCALAMMLPSKMEAFKENLKDNQSRPSHCWVKVGGKNYK